MKEPNAYDIPTISGINDKDGMIMLNDAQKKLDLYDNDMARMIPVSVNISPLSECAEQVGDEIKKFYFGDKSVCKETLLELGDLMTDYHFALGQVLSTELGARFQHK